MFGLPGQRTYRYVLGETLPPPVVRFSDAVLRAEDAGEDLPERARRLEAAVAAAKYGLPADAFSDPSC